MGSSQGSAIQGCSGCGFSCGSTIAGVGYIDWVSAGADSTVAVGATGADAV